MTDDTETESTEDMTEAEDSGFSAIISASTLSSTLNSVSTLVDECKIHFNEDGIDIRAVDPANVGMVDVGLDKEAFEAYSAGGGVIGVDLTRLEDIVSMAGSSDLVDMSLNEETRKMEIQLDGLEYTLALIDVDAIREEPDIPDLELPGRTVLKGQDIDRGIKAADMVSNHIKLSTDGDTQQFEIEATGDTDDVHLELGEDDVIDAPTDSASALYSLDYLKDMNKPIPGDAAVTVELGKEMPMKMHFDFADGLGNTTYMLAPRIQSD